MSHPFVPPEHTCEPLGGGLYADSPNLCPACAIKNLIDWLEEVGFYRLPENYRSSDKDFCLRGETWRKVKALK